MNNVIHDIRIGDLFGESSYYIVKKVTPTTVKFTHTATNKEVEPSHSYVTQLLTTADQYENEVTVGLLDKVWTAKQVADELKKNPNFSNVEGDLKQKGIKTIWAEVGSRPFTVCFTKKGKTLSATAYSKKVKQVVEEALQQIDAAKNSRKGVAKTAGQIIEDLINNPVSDVEPGEERILRGIKLQHESSDGFYQVIDFDITTGDNKRLVNLNTIKWIVVGGTKYIVE